MDREYHSRSTGIVSVEDPDHDQTFVSNEVCKGGQGFRRLSRL